MKIFAFSINDCPSQPDVSTGYVDAKSLVEAIRLVDDVRGNIYQLPDDADIPQEVRRHFLSGNRLWVADHGSGDCIFPKD